ncbi:unnamed protein product [Microthlaspi erraticum]|uniref:Uncharacterized protein n=1 Tax=Microthlaspi erraticum TaxID=1685480 RepID=A0A6D2JGX7_9BRAS|nr:unnamed protein product [Microthlaspi erraticum]
MEEEKTPLLFEIDSYWENDSSTNICLSETELSNSTEIKEAGFKIDWSEEKHDEIKKANVGGTQVQGFKAAWKRAKARMDRDNKKMIAGFKKMTDAEEWKAAWKRAKARTDRDNKKMIAGFKKMTDAQEWKAAWKRAKAQTDRDNKKIIAGLKKLTDAQEWKAAWKRSKGSGG